MSRAQRASKAYATQPPAASSSAVPESDMRSSYQHGATQPPAASKHARQRSLRNVKDSTEDLQRQRSGRRKDSPHSSEASSYGARNGQQFRVGNIGNNGLIYLRCVRSRACPDPSSLPSTDSKRYCSPISRSSKTSSQYPVTPPQSGTEDEDHAGEPLPPPPPPPRHPPLPAAAMPSWRESLFSGTGTNLSNQPHNLNVAYGDAAAAQRPQTPPSPDRAPPKASLPRPLHGSSAMGLEPQRGPMKIVIDRASPRRPAGKSEGFTHGLTLLDVEIPHYRLGAPRFTGRGSAFLQSSINSSNGSEDPRSSVLSGLDFENLFPSPPNQPRPFAGLRALSQSSVPTRLSRSGAPSSPQKRSVSTDMLSMHTGTRPNKPSKLGPRYSQLGEESFVRLSPVTGQLVSATPSQLITQMTSPNLLDYELMTDFFLTYRSFMTSSSLAQHLVMRLIWAFGRADDYGRIIRVRTFVAIRHWILNYFLDDFYDQAELRKEFCSLINEACGELSRKSHNAAGDLKILGELKRGWNQECNKFWEVLDLESKLPLDDIHPGGSPHPLVKDDAADFLDAQITSPTQGRLSPNPFLDMIRRARESQPQPRAQQSMSPTSASKSALLARDSDQSSYYVSCSIPTPMLHKAADAVRPSTKLRPRPVDRADTPKTAKAPPSAYRPFSQHQRSASFSDSQRDLRTSGPKEAPANHVPVELLPGSLARGALFQPISIPVDVVAPPSPTEERSPFEFVPVETYSSFGTSDRDQQQQQPAGPAVRKLIGSVRRALSIGKGDAAGFARSKSSEPLSRPMSTEPPSRQSRGPSRAASRNPSRKSSVGATKRKPMSEKTPQRIDFLCVAAADSFKRAIKEDFEAKSIKRQRVTSPSPTRRLSVPDLMTQDIDFGRIQSDITAGSRSILIMNGTGTHNSTGAQGKPGMPNLPDAAIDGPVSLDGKKLSVPFYFDPQSAAAATDDRRATPNLVNLFHQPTTSPAGEGFTSSTQGSLGATSVVSAKSPQPSRIPVRGNASSRSGAQQLRKYASVQSGKAKLPAQTRMAESEIHPRVAETEAFANEREPSRGLRRMPGGDLRGVEHVHDLDVEDGSSDISTVTPSKSAGTPIRKLSNSTGRLLEAAQSGRNESISLLDTHSSQPMLRPSFEQEVSKLANLPDDADNGDIKSTLDKLEGRYRPSSSIRPESVGYNMLAQLFGGSQTDDQRQSKRRREEEVLDNVLIEPIGSSGQSIRSKPSSNTASVQGKSLVPKDSRHSLFAQTQSLLGMESVRSEESYNSVPLLERGVSQSARLRKPMEAAKRINITRQTPKESVDQDRDATPGLAITTDEPPRKDSETLSAGAGHINSFYIGDNDSLSSLSSGEGQTRVDSLGRSPAMRSFYETENTSVPEDIEALPSTGRRTPNTIRSAISPPPLPPPPKDYDFTDSSAHASSHTAVRSDSKSTLATRTPKTSKSAQELRAMTETPVPAAVHMPWVLGYDSLVLAQQFTLIERDALQEIEWRELIEIKWHQKSPPVYDWVDYLRATGLSGTAPARCGVDLCIARFNLVVKWSVSEIVLTQDLHERAATIVKMIHIAHNCRRLRNWATMYQITTALVSGECARLRKTWTLIPAHDKETLKYLEALVLPMRNFHNLRTEMESSTAKGNYNDASTAGLNGACVPFVGIFTHDLIYNGQKPEFSNPPPGYTGDEKFVNFERYHTASNIVKNLLAFVESSGRYAFPAVPEVLSRCLWLSALGDEELGRRAKDIEERDGASGVGIAV